MSCLRTAFLFTWRLWAGKGDPEINICFAKSPNLRKGVLNEHRSNKDTAQGLGSICRSPIPRHTRTLTVSAPPAPASPTASSLHEARALTVSWFSSFHSLIVLLYFTYFLIFSSDCLFTKKPLYHPDQVRGKQNYPSSRERPTVSPRLSSRSFLRHCLSIWTCVFSLLGEGKSNPCYTKRVTEDSHCTDRRKKDNPSPLLSPPHEWWRIGHCFSFPGKRTS